MPQTQVGDHMAADVTWLPSSGAFCTPFYCPRVFPIPTYPVKTQPSLFAFLEFDLLRKGVLLEPYLFCLNLSPDAAVPSLHGCCTSLDLYY